MTTTSKPAPKPTAPLTADGIWRLNEAYRFLCEKRRKNQQKESEKK